MFAPLLNVEPEAGAHVTTGVVPSLSVADSPVNVTAAVVPPLSYSAVVSPGHVTTGGVVSVTNQVYIYRCQYSI